MKPHLGSVQEAIGPIQIQKSVMGMLHIVCGAGLIFPLTLPICAAGVITSALHPKTVVGAAHTPGSWNSLPWRRAGPIIACASDPALDAAAARVVKAAGAFGDDSAAFATKWTQKILAGETPLEMGLLEECLVDEGQDKCVELEEAIKGLEGELAEMDAAQAEATKIRCERARLNLALRILLGLMKFVKIVASTST